MQFAGERQAENPRRHQHPRNGADPENGQVQQAVETALDLRHDQQDHSAATGQAMDQPDTVGQVVVVMMIHQRVVLMIDMAAVQLSMPEKLEQPETAQPDQHEPDQGLKPGKDRFIDGHLAQYDHQADQEDHRGMAQPPEDPVLEGQIELIPLGDDVADRNQVVCLKRMAESDHCCKQQRKGGFHMAM